MNKKQSMFIVKSEAFSQLKVQRFLHLPNSNNKSVMNGPYFNKMISVVSLLGAAIKLTSMHPRRRRFMRFSS